MTAKPLLAGYLTVYPFIERGYFIKEYRQNPHTVQGVNCLIYPVWAGMGQNKIKIVFSL